MIKELVFATFLVFPFAAIHAGQETCGTGAAPFFTARGRESLYAGPGREAEEPAGLSEVRIGYFGPSDPGHPLGGTVWSAVTMAVEESNAAGGYRGLPFRLVPAWSENPWGTGISRLVRMVYDDHVWAVIGSIDGAATHLAEQVVAKARLTLINPVSTDMTVNLANVAWMFSAVPGDHLLAPVLGQALIERADAAPYVLVSATDHDSRSITKELFRHTKTLGYPPLRHVEFSGGEGDIAGAARSANLRGAKGVVILAGARESALLAAALRNTGFSGMILGGPGAARRAFIETAGEAAEGVMVPFLYDSSGAEARRFVETFFSRCGRVPDFADAHAYDSTCLLLAAIQKAGLNRARIRDALRSLSPWEGVSGPLVWDALGANGRQVTLATIRNGRAVPVASRTQAKARDDEARRGWRVSRSAGLP